MKHIIIGTAGHVDHGKTCLTKALTGVDTDRLKEEQKRGITIEIGFAKLVLPNGQTASIIDVPGHEKFIRNMLTGASGMDVVLLVVAADEGVMPQTREHLGILSLLGVKSGIIVVTKADMVEEEWLDAIMEETRENVEGTFLEAAPMLAVSAYTGQGLDELKAAIVELVDGATEKNRDKPMRLPVDRVFVKDGFGAVVTGTLTEGAVSVGDEVSLYPRELKARVRGVQNHDSPEERAVAGMRVALNLAGLGKTVRRGDTVAAPGSLTLTRQADVRLEMLKDAPYLVKNGSRHHLYHGTRELLCTVRLLDADSVGSGEAAFAQLRFSEDLAVKNADSFIIRFFSPTVTVGGGVILDASAKTHKRADLPAVLSGLKARASGSGRKLVLELIRSAGSVMPDERELTRSSALSPDEIRGILGALEEDGEIVKINGRYIDGGTLGSVWERAEKLLGDYHRRFPLEDGMNLNELRVKLGLGGDTTDSILNHFAANKGLRLRDGIAALPDFKPVFSPERERIRGKLEEIYMDAGLQPSGSDEVEASFGKEAGLCREVARKLRADGVLTALSPAITVHSEHYKRAESALYKMFDDNRELTLGSFRDEMGISRKYALALLEYWDGRAVTRKVGDVRVLVKRG